MYRRLLRQGARLPQRIRAPGESRGFRGGLRMDWDLRTYGLVTDWLGWAIFLGRAPSRPPSLASPLPCAGAASPGLSSETTAALVLDVVGLRLVAGLSLSRLAARHAQPSDRHGPVQIRRIQAERGHPGDPQPGLLEGGAALSERHRMDDRQRCVDPPLEFHRRPDGCLFRCHHPAVAGRQNTSPAGDLRRFSGERQPQLDRQPQRTALRQPRSPAAKATSQPRQFAATIAVRVGD